MPEEEKQASLCHKNCAFIAVEGTLLKAKGVSHNCVSLLVESSLW